MSFQTRKQLYENIEELRGRPLIVYITSNRPHAAGQMGADVIPHIANQIQAIGVESDDVDFLIASNGGDPNVSWRIVSMLREKFKRISCLLPYAAYSAATLIALGCDKIIMHPFSNLGPVDPQLHTKRSGKDHEKINFGSEDLRNYFNFIREDVGVSDQEQLERAFELVCNDVGPIEIGIAKRSSQLLLSLGEELLKLHMDDDSRISAIAEALNRSFYNHGYPLGMKEAKKIGLPVVSPPKEIEELIWNVWKDVEEEMECNMPFNPISEVFKDPDLKKLLSSVSQVQLPGNIPPQLAQQAYNNILQQIHIVSVPSVEYSLFHATVESLRCKSEFHSEGIINAVRLPDMNIVANIVPLKTEWDSFTVEPKESKGDDNE